MKKNKSLIAFSVSAVIIDIVIFSILYFGVFHINMQSPDNHLAIFNLFGIFYRDLFFACLISTAVGTVSAFAIYCKKIKIGYIAVSALISVIGGWAGAYLGGYVISKPSPSQAMMIVLQALIITAVTALIYKINHKEKVKEYEVQACCL